MIVVPVRYIMDRIRALKPEPEHVHGLNLESSYPRREGMFGTYYTYNYRCDSSGCDLKFSTPEIDRFPSDIGRHVRSSGRPKDDLVARMYHTL